MKDVSLALVLLFTMMQSLADDSAVSRNLVGVKDPQRAQYNWIMHCQGCHGVDARGSKGGAPNMVGIVSQFLHNEDGRAFLGRVPGVAFVELPDDEVAELLNWLLQTLDKEHMPERFRPYSAMELNQLRKSPLLSKAFVTRDMIIKELIKDNNELVFTNKQR